MRQLLPIHRHLLLLFSLGMIFCLVLFYCARRPAGQEYKNLTGTVSDLERQLTHLQASEDLATLDQLQEKITSRRAGLEQDLNRVMERYMSTYKPLIQKHNWTLLSFIRQTPKPTRNLYVQEYDRIIGTSPFGNLDGSTQLGLQRDSDEECRYLLLLRLWCVESLLSQANTCDLKLVFEKDEEEVPRSQMRQKGKNAQEKHRPALISLNPETLVMDDKSFSVLRFRIGLRGAPKDILRFIDSLGLPGTFFGVRNFELAQLPPPQGTISSGALEFHVECVTYVPNP